MFYSSHPNIFNFMGKLANIQAKTDIKIRGSEVVQPLQRRDDNCLAEIAIVLMSSQGGAELKR